MHQWRPHIHTLVTGSSAGWHDHPTRFRGQTVGRREEGQVHVTKALGFQTLNPCPPGLGCKELNALCWLAHKLHDSHAHAFPSPPLPITSPLLSLCASEAKEIGVTMGGNWSHAWPLKAPRSCFEGRGRHLLVAWIAKAAVL
jgi:hypothetical protein